MNEINVVPYIDVMLVLLIIFMVTAPMITPSVIDLPSMANTNPPKQMRPIEVTVRQVGNLLVKDMKTNKTTEVTLENLAAEVKKLQADEPDRPVVIQPRKPFSIRPWLTQWMLCKTHKSRKSACW